MNNWNLPRAEKRQTKCVLVAFLLETNCSKIFNSCGWTTLAHTNEECEHLFSLRLVIAAWNLLLKKSAAPLADPASDSIVEQAIKRLKTSVTTANSEYRDTFYIHPIFNICERMFSVAKHALTDHQRGIPPHSFDSQLFLYMNQNFWGIKDTKSIVRDNREETSQKETPNI